MESLQEYILPNREIDEDEFIKKLENCLNNGGNIDHIFFLHENDQVYGTLLHYSIEVGFEKIVKYVMSRGANIATEMTSEERLLAYKNPLELAAQGYEQPDPMSPENQIYEMLRKRNLELHSPYGLTPFHIDCAVRLDLWSDEAVQNLQTADVNAAISVASPTWPGMTPILIAAKFSNHELVKRLLDLGADTIARDRDGNTPLHYIASNLMFFYDERLFALDGRNTFGSYNGESHFHIACRFCPRTLHIVKRYLEQGISPDLQILETNGEENYSKGQTGLHLAAEKDCPELARLLLENGAEVDKIDSYDNTPMEHWGEIHESESEKDAVDFVCLLIEAGSNDRESVIDSWSFEYCISTDIDAKREFLSRVKRWAMLDKNLVCKNVKDVFVHLWGKKKKLIAEFGKADYTWNETEYAGLCAKELEALSGLGLRRILDDTMIPRSDFGIELGWLDSFNFESYPIYGSLLKMRFKRKLIEFERLKRKIRPAVPKVQWLFRKRGRLPDLCADLILWNLSGEELDQFMEK